MSQTISSPLRAGRLSDLTIGFRYIPPAGESRVGLTISGFLVSTNRQVITADSVSFNTETGQVIARWQEATVSRFQQNSTFEATFVRDRGGDTRTFYRRRVQIV